MKNRVFVSTGAFIGRVNNRDHRCFLRVADEIFADGFEFMVYNSWGDNTLGYIDDFIASGRNFEVLHADKYIGELVSLSSDNIDKAERLFQNNCRYASALRAKKIVLHLWNGVMSDKNFENHLRALPVFCDIANKWGLVLTVENVVCAKSSPLQRLLEIRHICPDIKYTYDTKMAAFHLEDAKAYCALGENIWKDGTISHIHCNDFGGVPGDFSTIKTLHIGDGKIDFCRFFSSIRGYDGDITLECSCMNPDGSVSAERINEDVLKVKKYVGEYLRQ